MLTRHATLAAAAIVLQSLAGCGGGSTIDTTTTHQHTVTVSGLSSHSSVTLQNSAGDDITLSANGATAFPASWASSSSYAITVKSHTPGVRCTVSNASGSMASAGADPSVACGAGTLSVLHSFSGTGSDGTSSVAALILDSSGNLYGTTVGGGAAGGGTVFKLAPDGSGGYTETVLYSFAGGSDGQNPNAGLALDSDGNLYGTAVLGGAAGGGTVFKVAPDGHGGYTGSVLYSFTGGVDGKLPVCSPVLDSAGNLYGTTLNGNGTVFMLATDGHGGYTQSVLHSFTGLDGQGPQAGLILDSAGNLYGTTSSGGASGKGAVVKLAPNGLGGYTESVLYSFQGSPDGQEPDASVILDSAGNLYGTTSYGGASGHGTVFKLTPDGHGGYTETVLYSFAGGSDGQLPAASLVLDSAGNLYGTTRQGGASSNGTVFKLAPDGSGGYTETVLYSFAGGSDGQDSQAGLILDSAGNLYGTTSGGGANGYGTVFKID